MITFELTDLEKACGVTLADAQREARRGLIRNGNLCLDPSIPPALAGAAARLRLAGPAEYVGHNGVGQPVYKATR